MKKLILKYGIIGGLISSILGTLNWLIIAHPLGVDTSQMVGYLSITLSLLCIPFGQRYFRDQVNQGKLTFAQAFKMGLGITAMAGIVMGIHSYLFFAFQKEEFLAWQRANLSPAELQAFNEQIAQSPEFVYTPVFQAIVMFVMVFLIGSAVNLISSLSLKKDS